MQAGYLHGFYVLVNLSLSLTLSLELTSLHLAFHRGALIALKMIRGKHNQGLVGTQGCEYMPL